MGHHALTSPLPEREPPKPIESVPNPPEPKPEPLKAERLPIVVAPVIAVPADARSHSGILEQTTVESDSRGSGSGGGVGKGTGTGIGEGEGTGTRSEGPVAVRVAASTGPEVASSHRSCCRRSSRITPKRLV